MKVKVKDFKVDMEIKNNGIELQVNDTDGTLLGDLYVTKSGLTWCKGRTSKPNGTKLTWKKFTEMMEGL